MIQIPKELTDKYGIGEYSEENYISEADITKILKFQKNPSDPSWME